MTEPPPHRIAADVGSYRKGRSIRAPRRKTGVNHGIFKAISAFFHVSPEAVKPLAATTILRTEEPDSTTLSEPPISPVV
jgi:hypothetical protein